MYNISFKAYNNKKLKQIHRNINTSAWVWNHIISLQKRYYKLYGKFINVNKTFKYPEITKTTFKKIVLEKVRAGSAVPQQQQRRV